MPFLARASLPALLALLGLAAPLALAEDVITLANGHVIRAERTWTEGSQLYYEKDGAVVGLPRSQVRSVERAEPPVDPEIRRALDRLDAGDPGDAVARLRAILNRDPRSAPALTALAQVLLSLGDAFGAAEAAQRAIRLDDRSARARELLGDARAAQGDASGAAFSYRESLRISERPELRRKLETLEPPPGSATGGAQFRLRYAGGVNEPLGSAVLDALGVAFDEYRRRLGFAPDRPVTVELQSEGEFLAGGGPIWAEGVYDGTIRIPVKGLAQTDPQFHRLLRHELAHSFLTARTRGNCPTWLHEGVAQWLEGGDPARNDAGLGRRLGASALLPLASLEAPFDRLPPAQLALAYSESLSGVAHLLRLRGEAGLARLLAALGDGLPSEEALPAAIGMSYPEFEKSWEIRLRATAAASPGASR